jgi:twitching motility protein PilT
MAPLPPGAAPAGNGQPLPPATAENHRQIEAILRFAFENGYSDVHLGVGEEPRFRERGRMIGTGWPVTGLETFMDWLRQMLSPGEIDRFLTDKEFDGSFGLPFVRVRINLLESVQGPAMVMRLIPTSISTLEDLNLPEVFRTLAARKKGMILVTGPTGSGKSTTLAAMIDHINRTMPRHILTIEDPVEFVHTSRLSLVRHREVGTHTREFSQALRAAMREDPDVILIGEIRDQETLLTAMEAAQTGHLVFGTLHTNSAVSTVERILGMIPSEAQDNMRRTVSETLAAVISQGLVRTTDHKRVAYHDILVINDACRDYIQRAETTEIESIMTRSAFEGMQTINQSLAALVAEGRIGEEEAIEESPKPNELRQVLRGRTS